MTAVEELRRAKQEEREKVYKELELARSKPERMDALMLGVVATRLRSRYTSVEEAREAWNHSADTLLQQINDGNLEDALRTPARNAVAARAVREIANDGYLLIQLLREWC